MLHDGEAEARATRVAAARLVDAVEALEDPIEITLGDADPLVGHHDLHPRPGRPAANLHDTAVLAVLDGILDEVADRRRELAAVAEHPDRLGRLDRHHLDPAATVGDAGHGRSPTAPHRRVR